MRHLLAALLLVLTLLGSAPASAQSPTLSKPPPPPSAQATTPPALSPAEAQSVLDILNDPARRAAFAATLQTFLKATHAANPAPAPTAVPLAPGSVGAKVVEGVAQGATWLSSVTSQFEDLHKLLGNLPAVWSFLTRTASDPAARDQALRDFGGLAAFLLGAAAVEWALGRALRRPIARLASLAASQGSAGDEGATEATARRFARLLRVLRRLPFILARLLLELLPVGAFLTLATVLSAFAQPATQDVLALAIRAYVAARLVLVGVRTLVAPGQPSLRVVQLGDDGAGYTMRWTRRLTAVAVLGYLIIQIGDLYEMPASAREALIKAFSLVGHILLIVVVLQIRRPVGRALRAGSVSTPAMAALRDWLAMRWHWPAVFFLAASWVAWAARLRHGLERVAWVSVESVVILVAYRLATTLLLGGLERLLPPSAAEKRGAHRYLGLLRRILNTMLLTLTVIALLELWGLHALAWFQGGSLGGQLATAGGTVLIAGLICLGVWEAVNGGLDSQLARLTDEAQVQRAARLRTLLPILRTSLLITLLIGFGLTALSEIGVNIAPLLAGAGIVGVAIGFGSQKLVQDFITGIFLLLENAMQVGDWVTVAGLSGTVEALSIRTLKLRGTDGAVHIIPFSAVTTVSNTHRGVGVISVSLTVDASQDTDQVSDVLAAVAQALQQERRFADMMLGGFHLFGVDRLEAGTATVTGQITCSDTGKLPVQREFNRRLNIRLRELGIRLVAPVQSSMTITPVARATPPATPSLPAPSPTVPS
jgi:small-conductance mechanosensitive channel